MVEPETEPSGETTRACTVYPLPFHRPVKCVLPVQLAPPSMEYSTCSSLADQPLPALA